MGTLGIDCMSHYDDDATIFHNNENRNSLRASSLSKEYREKSRVSDTQNKTREQGAGEKKWELLVSFAPHDFAAHSHVRLPLEMDRLLPVHNISC